MTVMAAGAPRIDSEIKVDRGLGAPVTEELLGKFVAPRYAIEDQLSGKMAKCMRIENDAGAPLERDLNQAPDAPLGLQDAVSIDKNMRRPMAKNFGSEIV